MVTLIRVALPEPNRASAVRRCRWPVVLTLLGAAGKSLLKANTVKTRTHSLLRQGCSCYAAIPAMPRPPGTTYERWARAFARAA